MAEKSENKSAPRSFIDKVVSSLADRAATWIATTGVLMVGAYLSRYSPYVSQSLWSHQVSIGYLIIASIPSAAFIFLSVVAARRRERVFIAIDPGTVIFSEAFNGATGELYTLCRGEATFANPFDGDVAFLYARTHYGPVNHHFYHPIVLAPERAHSKVPFDFQVTLPGWRRALIKGNLSLRVRFTTVTGRGVWVTMRGRYVSIPIDTLNKMKKTFT